MKFLPKNYCFQANNKDRVKILAKLARRRDACSGWRRMSGINQLIRRREEAQAKFDELQALIDPLSGLAMLHSYLGDLSAYDVDGPVPEVVISGKQVRSIGENLLNLSWFEACGFRGLAMRWICAACCADLLQQAARASVTSAVPFYANDQNLCVIASRAIN
jgi:hypothetical protein